MSALERICGPVRVRRMRRVVGRVIGRVAALALVGAAVVSCSGGESTTDPLQPTGRTANVVINSAPGSLVVGGTVALSAVAQDASGNIVPEATIHWSSSDDAIATVSSVGVVTAKAPGSVQIAASAEGHSALVTLAVTNVPVASVTVAPNSVSLALGGTATLTAIAYDQNGNALTGRPVTWASSAPSVATVDGNGVVTSVAQGSATVTATSEGKTAGAAITVTAPPAIPVASVAVAPTSSSLTVGATTTLTAITYDANGNTLTGRGIVWASSAPAVASVSTSGVVTAKSAGTATITATSEGKTGSATINVTTPAPVPVSSVTVAPPSSTVVTGSTVTLTAVTYDAQGHTLSGRQIVWASTANGVATVNGSGTVTAVAPGTATITATSEGKTGSATITVTAPAPVPVATVDVSPTTATIDVGTTTTLSATTKDSRGNILTGRVVDWSSSNQSVATVSSSGVVTAVAAGTATITASSEGQNGTAAITVKAPPPPPAAHLDSLAVTTSLPIPLMRTGTTMAVTVTALDASGNVLPTPALTWSSTASSVASVASTGANTALVTAHKKTGTVTITVSSGRVHTDIVVVVF